MSFSRNIFKATCVLIGMSKCSCKQSIRQTQGDTRAKVFQVEFVEKKPGDKLIYACVIEYMSKCFVNNNTREY